MIVATQSGVLVVAPERPDTIHRGAGLDGRTPTCLAVDPRDTHRAYCGTRSAGVLGSDDGGLSWVPAGLAGTRVTALAAAHGRVWAGAEPSALWSSDDRGATWRSATPLEGLPSSGTWAFPPRPETHHVRWIAPHPDDPSTLWLAIEAGALVRTHDGGASWLDRVEGGPYDTHELAIHPELPETLRVAAGDGFFLSRDGGAHWEQPEAGLDVGYLRSVAVDPGDPEVVVVSAASHAHAAYVTRHSDGRLYRRVGSEPWRRVTDGWPEEPENIAPLVRAGTRPGELWAVDERGVHRSVDGGVSWAVAVPFSETPSYLNGFAVV